MPRVGLAQAQGGHVPRVGLCPWQVWPRVGMCPWQIWPRVGLCKVAQASQLGAGFTNYYGLKITNSKVRWIHYDSETKNNSFPRHRNRTEVHKQDSPWAQYYPGHRPSLGTGFTLGTHLPWAWGQAYPGPGARPTLGLAQGRCQAQGGHLPWASAPIKSNNQI